VNTTAKANTNAVTAGNTILHPRIEREKSTTA
jgi:hypothetical protein